MFEEPAIDPGKVAAYVRWSTDEQGAGTTLETQTEACKTYIEEHDWRFQESLLFVDDGYSGGSLKRPGMDKLRTAVFEGEVECVVVFKVDRLSRSVLDTVNLVLKEWDGKCYIKSARESIDTTSPMGKQFFYMLVTYAEWERSVIRDRTVTGKLKRAQQGRNAGQKYPYGYKKGSNGTWELMNWDQNNRCFTGPAAIVQRIFRQYLAGEGTPSVARGLNADGIPAPEGGKWRAGTVAGILSNPIYAGIYTYGMRSGKDRKAGPPKYEVEGVIPPIVSTSDFEQAKHLRRERGGQSPRALASPYLLSGIATCHSCGHSIVGSKSHDTRYYVCSHRKQLDGCDCAYIGAEEVEKAVISQVRAVLEPESLAVYASEVERRAQQAVEERNHVVKLLEDELLSINRRRKRVDDDYTSGELEPRLYSKLADSLDQALRDTTAKLDDARHAAEEVGLRAVNTAEFLTQARRLHAWDHLSVEETKQILREITAELQVYQRRATDRRGNGNPVLIDWRPRLDMSSRLILEVAD